MNHEDLKRRTTDFSRRIRQFTKPLLRSVETQDEARQLRRAASGIRMNYRAAGLGRTHKEFTARLGVVLEEADEAQGWLQSLVSSENAGNRDALDLLKEATELRNIFAASYATARRNEGEGRG